jgi:hypothetical protein
MIIGPLAFGSSLALLKSMSVPGAPLRFGATNLISEFKQCVTAARLSFSNQVILRPCTRPPRYSAQGITTAASLARGVLFFEPAFKYLSSVLSRKVVPKFDNFRDLKVRELPCEKILNLLRGQHFFAVGLYRSNK